MAGIWETLVAVGRSLMNLLTLYTLGAYYLFKELLTPHRKPSGIIDREGLVAIVTGGGRGIGLETVSQLMQRNVTVVIAGQDVSLLKYAVAELRQSGITTGRAICLELTLSEQNSVRHFVKEFLALDLPLNILINNAGIMFAPYCETIDGFESHWSVNYLSHFLLTHLMMPVLRHSATPEFPSRVVNVSSSVHYIGDLNFDDVNQKDTYSPEAAYSQSKLALVMMALHCNARQGRISRDSNIFFNCVHPGVVFSQLFKHVFWAKYFPFLVGRFLKTPKQGADTVIYAAMSSCVNSGGNYYENCQVESPARSALSLTDQSALFKLSCKQCHIPDFDKP